MTSRRKLYSLCRALVNFLVALVLATAVLVVTCRFYPGRRLETAPTASVHHRVFTVTGGWLDVSANLYASDWPHTLTKPVLLGDLYWPENYDAHARWSGDGTVVAMQKRWNTGPDWLFTSAYDFREHRVIRDSHSEITSLLENRGGWEGPVIRWDDGKGGEHSPYRWLPFWAWILLLLILACGLLAARRRLVSPAAE